MPPDPNAEQPPRDADSPPADETVANTEADATLVHQTVTPHTGGSAPPPAAGGASQGELPRQFGRYRLERKLGQGAMGAVYLAHDTQLDRQVALKVPFFAQDQPEVVDRFYREARAMATLHHPNLCPIHDVGEIDGVHYLTMAFIDGRPLQDFVKSGQPLPGRQVAALIRKIAIALHEAHEANIVHRDLKPANIMIDKRKEPIVMDFGLARRQTDDEIQLTQTGAVMGSPAYMSPEQVEGDQQKIGRQTDVYSLGVIMYRMLCGRLPFEGSMATVLGKIALQDPSPPREFHAAVDPQLETICLKAMAKPLEDRYQTAQEFAAALHGYLSNSTATVVETREPASQQTPPQSVSQQSAAPRPLPAAPSTPLAPQTTTASGAGGILLKVVLLLLAGLGGLVLLCGGLLFWLSSGPTSPADFPGGGDGGPVAPPPPPIVMESTGPRIISASADGTIRSWDLESGEPLGILWEEDRVIRAIAATPDGSRLVFAAGKIVTVCDREGNEIYSLTDHERAVWSIAVSTDGAHAASASVDATVRVWDLANGETLYVLEDDLDEDFYEVVLSDKHVLASADDGEVVIWNLADGETFGHMTHDEKNAEVYGIDVDAEGHLAVSAGSDNQLHVWQVGNTEEWISSLGNANGLEFSDVCFTRDGVYVIAGDDSGEVMIWDWADDEEYYFDQGHHNEAVNVVAVTPDDRFAVSGSADGTVKIWDLNDIEITRTLRGHSGGVHALVIVPGE